MGVDDHLVQYFLMKARDEADERYHKIRNLGHLCVNPQLYKVTLDHMQLRVDNLYKKLNEMDNLGAQTKLDAIAVRTSILMTDTSYVKTSLIGRLEYLVGDFDPTEEIVPAPSTAGVLGSIEGNLAQVERDMRVILGLLVEFKKI